MDKLNKWTLAIIIILLALLFGFLGYISTSLKTLSSLINNNDQTIVKYIIQVDKDNLDRTVFMSEQMLGLSCIQRNMSYIPAKIENNKVTEPSHCSTSTK